MKKKTNEKNLRNKKGKHKVITFNVNVNVAQLPQLQPTKEISIFNLDFTIFFPEFFCHKHTQHSHTYRIHREMDGEREREKNEQQ